MREFWRRLTGHRAPDKQEEYETLERAKDAARKHRERSETRLDESLSRVRRMLDSYDDEVGQRPRGHAD